MEKRLTIPAILILAAASCRAAVPPADSLAASTVEHRSPMAQLRSKVFDNPSMQSLRFKTSLNAVYAQYGYADATSPVRLEYGTGHSIGAGHMDAYLHKGKATLWGQADYVNGRTRDIRFCESSDFDVIAPYAMADTVGGTTRHETCHFMGGFSWPVGRFNIGAEGEYTAVMAYRTKDPRPKNLTGDLRAKVGASYLLTDNSLAGIALSARKYKQTNEVEIYNEVSMPVIYHLTGLGMDYYRFRGDYTGTYYEGWAWGGMATFTERDNQGLFAHVGYERSDIDKIISSLNQLPMSTLVTHDASTVIGYSLDCGRASYGAAAFADMEVRNGTENVFGTAQDNIFPKIAEATQYRQQVWRAGAQAVWQQAAQCGNGYALSLKAAYASHDERYLEPRRRMKASALQAALCIDGHAVTGRFLLTGRLSGQREWALSHSLALPDGVGQDAMLTPVRHYYAYLSANRWQTVCQAEAAWRAGTGFMPFVGFAWQYRSYAGAAHSNQLEVNAGVRF